ncbi:MAG TPA: endolytic transglycosylase MltG [Methylomirabilota bacterium]|nr:endolytic transglycosylase MltG [Methylomirabilota bacterium]
MERPRSLKPWGSPGPSGPTWRTAAGLGVLVMVLFLMLEGWWILTVPDTLHTSPRVVEIPAHKGVMEVAEILDDAGVIRSRVGFVMLAVARGSFRSLKAGEYQIPQGTNTVRVLERLEGGHVMQHMIVFQEGGTLGELARQLEAERLAPASDILRVARDAVFLKTLDIQADSVEGYLFPDTYQFVKGMTPEEILARMVARMREKLSPELVAEARARNLSVHQMLTLASIIEKEAVESSEMPLISAVFWNRLHKLMPLQADPTVQYAVGKDRRRLTREDLQVDSPYNTYRRQGLPPGPIASPGRAAMQAAVRPANVKYLYFVAMDDRHHQFSTNLADHNAAVARYRLARAR